MRLILAIATVLLAIPCGNLTAQSNRTKVGNAMAARMRAEMHERIAWNEAKKLSRRKGVDFPRRDVESLRNNELQPETVGWIVGWPLRVLDVLDDENCLLISRSRGTLWLTGYDTEGLVDEESVRVYDPVKMVGTKEYQAVSGGTRRVKQIRMLNAEEEREWLAEQEEAERLDEYPEWTSSVGSTVRAKFLRYVGGRVLLETIEGRELRLRLSDFADESADRLRELIQEAREDG